MPQYGPILSEADFGDVRNSTSPTNSGTVNGETGNGLEKRTSSPNAVDEVTFDATNGRIGGNEILTPVDPPLVRINR